MASFKDSLGDATADKTVDPNDIFTLTEKLGEGSYGSVFKGIHKETGNSVAVKMVPVEGDFEDIAKEIRILKQCDSVYIVKYYGSYTYDDSLWIVMEYCGGGGLDDLMEITGQTLSEGVIKEIIAASLLGLAYLHKNKNVHRDIKSGNILLSENGQAKLADFGVSATLASTMSKQNTVIGTPYWMAPEIIQEKGYDGKADIWSLGITMIELGEGEPPLHKVHPMRAIFMIPTKPPPTFEHPEDWSEEMKDFLKLCLVKDPNKRSSAVVLLEHPWIANTCVELEKNDGKSSLLASLVDQCMEQIQEFREREEEEDSGSSSSDDDDAASSPGTKSGDTSKSELPPCSGDWDSGTMVQTSASPGLPPTSDSWDSGTMVMTSPVKETKNDDVKKPALVPPSDDWGDSGTMVMTSDAVRKTRGDFNASGTMVMTNDAFDSGTCVMTGGGSGGGQLAVARAKFEAEEKEAREGKSGDGGGVGVEDLYRKYLLKRKENKESLKKVDDEDEKEELIESYIEEEELLFAKVLEDHLNHIKELQEICE